MLAPRPVRLLERLDRQLPLPHSIGHLAKAEPGPGGESAPSRRLVGAQRFVEFSEGLGPVPSPGVPRRPPRRPDV